MESTDGQYGWAADDPRWTDELAGGRGRLEPSPPPRFGATDAEGPTVPVDAGDDLTASPVGAPNGSADAPPFVSGPPSHEAPVRPLDLPQWPPAPPTFEPPAAEPSPLRDGPPTDLPRRDPFGPPLAISATPSPAPPPLQPPPLQPPPLQPPSMQPPPLPPSLQPPSWATPPSWSSSPSVPAPALPDFPPTRPPLPEDHSRPTHAPGRLPGPVPTAIPLRVHASGPESRPTVLTSPIAALPGPTGVELRTGYGLSAAATASAGVASANGSALAREARPTRLDRRVRIRSRWRGDDEFRRAGRAELFSDDARYQVLFALTAAWYVPVAVISLLWVLLVSGDGDSGTLFSILGWLAFAAGLSVAIAGLLRWASVGWRAITLSLAAALIGGGLATIAQTLTG